MALALQLQENEEVTLGKVRKLSLLHTHPLVMYCVWLASLYAYLWVYKIIDKWLDRKYKDTENENRGHNCQDQWNAEKSSTILYCILL